MKLINLFETSIRQVEQEFVDDAKFDKVFPQRSGFDIKSGQEEEWANARLDFIHIDDQMGNDVIYKVDGKFIFVDRHTGVAIVANTKSEDAILDAVNYWDQEKTVRARQ